MKKCRVTAVAIDWKPIFLDQFSKNGNVSQAAIQAGVHRTTVYAAMQADSDFAEAYTNAKEVAYDYLEKIAHDVGD